MLVEALGSRRNGTEDSDELFEIGHVPFVNGLAIEVRLKITTCQVNRDFGFAARHTAVREENSMQTEPMSVKWVRVEVPNVR